MTESSDLEAAALPIRGGGEAVSEKHIYTIGARHDPKSIDFGKWIALVFEDGEQVTYRSGFWTERDALHYASADRDAWEGKPWAERLDLPEPRWWPGVEMPG